MAEEIIRDWSQEFDGDLSFTDDSDIEPQDLRIVHPMSSTLKEAGGQDFHWFDVLTRTNHRVVDLQFLLTYTEQRMGLPQGGDERKRLFGKLEKADETKARELASEDAFSLCYAPDGKWSTDGIREGDACSSCPYGRRGSRICTSTFYGIAVLVGDPVATPRIVTQKLRSKKAAGWHSGLIAETNRTGVLLPSLVFKLGASEGRSTFPITLGTRAATHAEMETALGVFLEYVVPMRAALLARVKKGTRALEASADEADGSKSEEPLTQPSPRGRGLTEEQEAPAVRASASDGTRRRPSLSSSGGDDA